jgi:hypothetical protein
MSRKVTFQSFNSQVCMTVDQDEPFGDIAFTYVAAGHGPTSGVELTYKGRLIQASDTPKSLGIMSSGTVQVTYV